MSKKDHMGHNDEQWDRVVDNNCKIDDIELEDTQDEDDEPDDCEEVDEYGND